MMMISKGRKTPAAKPCWQSTRRWRGKVRGTHSNEHSIPEPTPETDLTCVPRNQRLLSLGGEPSPQPCDSSSPHQELLTQCAHCYSSQALTSQLDRRTSAEPCLFQVVSVAAFVVGSAAQAMRRLYLTRLSDSMMGTLHSEKMADSMLGQHAARCEASSPPGSIKKMTPRPPHAAWCR